MTSRVYSIPVREFLSLDQLTSFPWVVRDNPQNHDEFARAYLQAIHDLFATRIERLKDPRHLEDGEEQEMIDLFGRLLEAKRLVDGTSKIVTK